MFSSTYFGNEIWRLFSREPNNFATESSPNPGQRTKGKGGSWLSIFCVAWCGCVGLVFSSACLDAGANVFSFFFRFIFNVETSAFGRSNQFRNVCNNVISLLCNVYKSATEPTLFNYSKKRNLHKKVGEK